MTAGWILLKRMLEEGAEIPERQFDEVATEIDEAIAEKHFHIVRKDSKVIGFFTLFFKDNKLFINNCIIYQQFRDKNNLLYMRKYFRENFKDWRFFWESKKNNKMCCVR